MNENKPKIGRNIVILISVIMVALLVLLFVFLVKSDVFGDSLLAPALMFISLAAALCIYAFICMWVYQDCMKRGENSILWMLIILVASPVIALIIYLITRREEQHPCIYCGGMIRQGSRYCGQCGEENPIVEKEIQSETKHRRRGLLFAAVLSAVIMVGCLITFIILAFTSDNFVNSKSINMGYIMMSVENRWGNDWKLNFQSGSDGYRKKTKFKRIKKGQTLEANIQCGEGKLLLYLTQGDKEKTFNVSNLKEPLQYDFSDFEEGTVEAALEIHGAKDVKSRIQILDEQP